MNFNFQGSHILLVRVAISQKANEVWFEFPTKIVGNMVKVNAMIPKSLSNYFDHCPFPVELCEVCSSIAPSLVLFPQQLSWGKRSGICLVLFSLLNIGATHLQCSIPSEIPTEPLEQLHRGPQLAAQKKERHRPEGVSLLNWNALVRPPSIQLGRADLKLFESPTSHSLALPLMFCLVKSISYLWQFYSGNLLHTIDLRLMRCVPT